MMANPLQLDWQRRYVPLPGEPYVRLETFAQYMVPSDLMQQAQERVQVLEQEAHEVLEEAKKEVEVLLEQAKVTAEEEIQRQTEQACEQAIGQAVQWMCKEQELEQTLAKSLVVRWRTVTARILQAVLVQNDQDVSLLRQVERKVIDHLQSGLVQLYISPETYPTACSWFANQSRLIVKIDPSLTKGQARLDNGQVRIHFDLPQWQQRLLRQFCESSVEHESRCDSLNC